MVSWREPAAVPAMGEPARHAVDLGAADGEAVVVKLLAKPQRLGAALVEGEVDHGALRAQGLQRSVQAVGMGARLEHEIGAAIRRRCASALWRAARRDPRSSPSSPSPRQRFPGLETRANRYLPLLRRIVAAVIAVHRALSRCWKSGASTPSSGSMAARSAAGCCRRSSPSASRLLAAAAIREVSNALMERQIDTLSRGGQFARAARLRTFQPMLRTALLCLIVTVVGLTALSEIGVNIAPLLAGAGIVGIAVGFGSQKLVQDLITGLFLLLENAMQVGDVVSVAGLSGTVENVSIRTIRLRAGDGSVHIVPFSAVTTSPMPAATPATPRSASTWPIGRIPIARARSSRRSPPSSGARAALPAG